MSDEDVWYWGRMANRSELYLKEKKETFKSGLAHEFSTGLLKGLILDTFI